MVVLLHGGGQTRHAWRGTGAALSHIGYRCIAMDARGHGDSSWAEDGRYEVDRMVDDLVEVLDGYGCLDPVLVGASMGGVSSLVAVGEGRVAARALVLVDVAHRIEDHGRDKVDRFMSSNPDGFASLEEVAAAVATYQPHRPRPTSPEGLRKNVRIGADGRYRWHWDPVFRSGPAKFEVNEQRLATCTSALAVPTLLVRGAWSDVLSEEGASEFLELCPAAELVTVERADHMVAGDRNDRFGAAVIEFLQRVDQVGRQ
jgi:non-heme chloroperoxidase